ncbi:hypothetical protein [Priestia koreensis]|nr:hypothetical protein [Priestia koreensis]MCM3003101.1 hypothetical protein [Priestia koreensis]UNL85911.1 hypothetical protein IE339_05225 [Priestia koreensis]
MITMLLVSAPVYALFQKTRTDVVTFSTGSGFFFYYLLNSTNTMQPNNSSTPISTGQNQTLKVNIGILSSLLDPGRTIANIFTITNKTNQTLNVQMTIENTSQPTLSLVGIDYILGISNQTIAPNTTKSVSVTAQFLPLLKIGGRYTGNIVLKDVANNLEYRVPVEVVILIV